MSDMRLLDLLIPLAKERGSKLSFGRKRRIGIGMGDADRISIWRGAEYLGLLGLVHGEWYLVPCTNFKRVKVHPSSPTFFDDLEKTLNA